MLKVKVKNISKLTDTLEEEDGQYHCEGVLYKPEVIEELRGMNELVIKDFYHYNGKYAIGIKKANGVTTYISPRWVSEVTDGTTTVTTLKTSCKKMTGYIEFKAGKLIDTATMTIKEKSSLPICNCGNLLDNDETLLAVRKCKSCYESEHYKVQSYSYKPAPEFTGSQISSNNGNEVWYGIELEYGLNDKLGLTKLVAGNAIYLKSDSSINTGSAGGAEMVTHPYSFSELMKEDSWVNKLGDIDCNESDRNGCHVHVSRTAWIDDKHFALTYFLMYEMATSGYLEKIGGRTFNGYCELHAPTERIHQVKKEKVGGKSRSMWLNENNDATVEFRFFNGTNDPKQLKRYLQLLEGVIKYTKFHSKSVSTKGLFAYIRKYNNKYGELNEFTTGWDIDDKTVTYTEPKQNHYDFNKIPLSEVSFISKIYSTDGKEYKDVRNSYVDNTYLYFQCKGRSESLKLTSIAKVTVEV